MRERGIREFFGSEIPKDLEKLSEIQRKVFEGLRLEEGTPSNYFVERSQLVGVIAETIYDTTEYLCIDVPRVGLVYDWKDDVGRRIKVLISAETSKGQIKFSPHFLEGVMLDFVTNGVDDISQIRELIKITSHEVYHYYQLERFPNSTEKDFTDDVNTYNLFARLDLKMEKMPHSRAERGALKFAKLVEKVKKYKKLK